MSQRSLKGGSVTFTVSEIHRFPVKSMRGELVDKAYLTWHGLVGDRAYAVIRRENGPVVITAKMREGHPLLQCTATYHDREIHVRLPNDTVHLPGTRLNRELSDMLLSTVHLKSSQSQGEREYPTNYKPPFNTRPGVFVDSSPLHIVTTASLNALGAKLRVSASELVQRFRPNLVIDGTMGAFDEQTWVGRRLTIGDTEVLIRKETDRCPLTAAPQLNLDSNPDVLRELTQNHNKNFGVYAVVIKPGIIRTYDLVTID